ncbi:MAG: hypothetical protein GY716_19075 [bacterium]|nr:hypothetical protein [bacterium]
MFDDYVKVDTTPLFATKTGSKKTAHLLWGDGVKFVGSTTGSRVEVRARGRKGWVKKGDLGGESLLEFYFIDVGQGDGVLIKTPGFKHVLIDGGFPRSMQETGKNAADFVDWKFVKDYGKKSINLDVMMASHNDADHYGGLMDMLDAAQSNELDATKVTVEKFYHAGLSWWKTSSGGKTLGTSKKAGSESFWTQLLSNRASALAATGSGAGAKLHGWWAKFVKLVTEAKKKSGSPTSIQRLSHVDGFVPGFEPDGSGAPSIKILGPVEFAVDGKSAVRKFSGGNSKNTNGVSLLLRVDYGRSRVLLTGDLNTVSQHSLLEDYEGERTEFLCDVAKACHHGSADVSYRFLQAMRPAATVISSGDNEGHDHPRPAVVAASATTGFLQVDPQSDKIKTPLVYSTELGRSVDLGEPTSIETRSGNTTTKMSAADFKRSRINLKKTGRKSVGLPYAKVVGGLIYGLVNVRTDGEKILCASLDEKDSDWRIESFESRF